jgi:hypothetical protein
MISVLSRLAERSMSGLTANQYRFWGLHRQTNFSIELARAVTQPLWPSRVPRNTRCSDIVRFCLWKGTRCEGDEGGRVERLKLVSWC